MRCEPTLPYDPDFRPPSTPDPRRPVPVSRRGFIELCQRLAGEDEAVFAAVWRRLGLSVDWSLAYSTIDERSRRTAQLAFLRDLRPRRRVPGGRADAVGRGLRHRGGAGRAGRPGGRRRLVLARRSDSTQWTPPGPSCCRPAWRWWPTRTTSGMRSWSAAPLPTPLFGVEVPVHAHRAGRPGQGHRAGHGVHLRRPDRRDLVAGARRCRPGRCSAGTGGFRAEPAGRGARGGRTPSWPG